ncbi:hypothetical protein PSTG_07429 [Puccinia striiformis f. sp. tritici PST-78]|uniref:Uncharacterized protein n=1 Tax=Puccinia striiformis f. sp. tritici PST-78 TaxID=1165861 RepID=A0A0L0VJB7_9BASI|nr:hypothetical protein PSTG_07429 [Puccinia striiformis f. sp. tritici PST-78]
MAFALEAAFGTPLGPLTRRLASTGVPATFGEVRGFARQPKPSDPSIGDGLKVEAQHPHGSA